MMTHTSQLLTGFGRGSQSFGDRELLHKAGRPIRMDQLTVNGWLPSLPLRGVIRSRQCRGSPPCRMRTGRLKGPRGVACGEAVYL